MNCQEYNGWASMITPINSICINRDQEHSQCMENWRRMGGVLGIRTDVGQSIWAAGVLENNSVIL